RIPLLKIWTALDSRLPCRSGSRTVHHRQYLDPIREHNVVDEMAELPKPARSHVLPDSPIDLRHRLNAVEHLAHPRHEAATQAHLHLFQFVVRGLDVGLSGWPKDHG